MKMLNAHCEWINEEYTFSGRNLNQRKLGKVRLFSMKFGVEKILLMM
jgi:hypothetical protein